MEKDHSDSRDLRALVEERIVGGVAASSPPPHNFQEFDFK